MRKPQPGKERKLMADIRRHEGVWQGHRTVIDGEGAVRDRCATRTVISCPKNGPYAFRQEETLTWADGRVSVAEIGGLLKDKGLWFDTEDFAGRAWTADGVVVVDTDRKPEPRVRVREAWILGQGGAYRARTAHWFENGQCIKRIVYDEALT